MKTGLLVLLSLFVMTGLFAFEKGTINPGGYLSYTSYKENSDADAVNTLTIAPQVGYFVIDDLSVDVNLMYSSNDDDTGLGFGLGGRYFFPLGFYGGLGLMYESSSNGSDWSGTYLGLKGGYVLPLAEHVYADLGLHYDMGFGKYGGDWDEVDNEESEFGFLAGLQIFFPF